jgi:hypothetical protein
MWAHGSHQKEMQIKATAALWSQLLFSLRPIKMEEKQNADDRPAARFIIFVWMWEGLVVLSATTTAKQPKRVGARTAEPASKVYFPYKVIDYEFLSQKFSGGDSYTFAPLCLQRLKQQTLFNDEKWGDTPQERKILCVLCRKKSLSCAAHIH